MSAGRRVSQGERERREQAEAAGPVRRDSIPGGDVVVVGEGLLVGTGDKLPEGQVGTGCVVGK